ncbi:MAG: PTS sugar transporter subunit IIA [Treponema sp.]|nr:PTS sugar transporter subunit IIA [Treponema sp.]
MLSDFLKPETVIINLESTDKDSLFAEMTEHLVRQNTSLVRDDILSAVQKREEQMNTSIMKGVAVPHGVCSSVHSPVVAIGISKAGIDYDISGVGSAEYVDSLVHLVVFMLFEQENAERHLHILADCARVLQIPNIYQSLLMAKTSQEVCNIVRDLETSC